MKLNSIAGIKAAALLWLLLLWLPSYAQVPANTQAVDAKLKAVFLYNFTRYFEWGNERGMSEFHVGLMGADTSLVKEMRFLATRKQFHDVPLKINVFRDLSDMASCELLYVDVAAFPNYKLPPNIRNTLVVTDHGEDLYNTMIAFIQRDGKQKFAINTYYVKKAGLVLNPDFLALATTVVDKPAVNIEEKKAVDKWMSVFDKLSQSVKTKGDLTLSQSELGEVVDKLINQKEKIDEQLGSLELQKAELGNQEKRIRIQKEVLNEQKKDIEKQERVLLVQMDQINTQKTILWLSAAVVIVIILALGLVYWNYKKTRRINALLEQQKQEITEQHAVISNQKSLVEEQHKEITDSINYAQRIQHALLAGESFLKEQLKNYFVFFRPKNVVSGDFYWATLLKNGRLALVTADSTGHGVPGAIMSMLNISGLNESVEGEKLVEPAQILNHTRNSIIRHLANDGSAEGGKDGMDCSLLCFDFEKLQLTYAAANNPVWIVRNKILQELEADNMPVGKHDRDSVSFSQHTFDLQAGDMVYALTDGYPDQFGGPKGKKFMYKQMKELLTSISHLPMEEQHQRLTASLTDWMGSQEQVDDITVIGIRIS